MTGQTFVHLGASEVSARIFAARRQVLYCGSGVTLPVAGALARARQLLGKACVRVVLDVSDGAARLGYGEFDAITMLRESDVDLRLERGLRACILVHDDEGAVFFASPMLVEVADDGGVGVNAMVMHREQVAQVCAAVQFQRVSSGLPGPQHKRTSDSTNSSTSPPGQAVQERDSDEVGSPELGVIPVSEKVVAEVRRALDENPPQRFDVARKVNVFNSYLEFVEITVTSLRIAQHSVRLPSELLVTVQDDKTANRLVANFKLVDESSKAAKASRVIEKKVVELRQKYLHSLGSKYGNVIRRSKRSAFTEELEKIKAEIAKHQDTVIDQLQSEIDDSRRRLVKGLLPALRRKPPPGLSKFIDGKPDIEVLTEYVDDSLVKVFPRAAELVKEMKLEAIFKGVTYETLKNDEFQEIVRKVIKYVDWNKPFSEFEATPAVQMPLPMS
jgi:hypothetical protein